MIVIEQPLKSFSSTFDTMTEKHRTLVVELLWVDCYENQVSRNPNLEPRLPTFTPSLHQGLREHAPKGTNKERHHQVEHTLGHERRDKRTRSLLLLFSFPNKFQAASKTQRKVKEIELLIVFVWFLQSTH